MAQHISIKNSDNKELQNIYEGICKNFKKGISLIQFSLKFQEIFDEDYKESDNDKVFITWRNFKKIRETFEIHFNLQKNEVFEIYLVK
jgi:hypothetical protein